MIIKNILINPSKTILDALNLIQKNLHKMFMRNYKKCFGKVLEITKTFLESF